MPSGRGWAHTTHAIDQTPSVLKCTNGSIPKTHKEAQAENEDICIRGQFCYGDRDSLYITTYRLFDS